MREKEIKFKSGKFILAGKLFLPSKNTKTGIVFVSGFAEDMYHSHMSINTAREFCRRGYAVLIYNPRGGDQSTGSIIDRGIKDETQDLHSAIKFMKKMKFNKLGGIGHSLGGAELIIANDKNLSAMALWDPTNIPLFKRFILATIPKEVKSYTKYWADKKYGMVLNRKFLSDLVDFGDITPLIKKINLPILFVAGGRGILSPYVKKYFDNANEPKRFRVIKKATHLFEGLDDERELIECSARWFDKWLLRNGASK